MKNIIYIVCLFLFTNLNGQDTLYRFYIIKHNKEIQAVESYSSNKEGKRELPLEEVIIFFRNFYIEEINRLREENKRIKSKI